MVFSDFRMLSAELIINSSKTGIQNHPNLLQLSKDWGPSGSFINILITAYQIYKQLLL